MIEPKKICILRLSALGDVTHVLPVINLIKAKWPEVEITWICGSFEYKFLRVIEGVNFVTFNKREGFKAYLHLWKKLRGQRFDVLLHMQVAARANIASLGIKADIRLGWDKSRSRDFHQLFINHSVPEVHQQHQVEGFLSFAQTLGINLDEVVWKIPVTENARTFSEKYINKQKKVLIISACSSHELRNWNAERYAAVADYAVNKHNMQVILSGGPGDIEREMADAITTCMKHEALNLVGKDTLEQLVGLLNSASVVLSPDSGPAHLANALGIPVIGLYACTWSKRSGPYNSLEFCVDKFPLAAEKFLNKSAVLCWGKKIEQPGVMELISVEEVCAKLEEVLAK